jgi:hypothetical protein
MAGWALRSTDHRMKKGRLTARSVPFGIGGNARLVNTQHGLVLALEQFEGSKPAGSVNY